MTFNYLLLLLFARSVVGGVKGVLQSHQVFARFERIKNGLLGFELIGGVLSGLDREANAAVALVNLDDAGGK